MNVIDWLHGGTGEGAGAGSGPLYYERFPLDFGAGRLLPAVRVPYDGDVARVMAALGLTSGVPALFISGGAGRMTPDELDLTRPAVLDGLARFAEDYGVAVVDGGTDSGIMKLMGEAHHDRGCRFPLIGVAPVGAIAFPGYDNPDGIPLNAGHTHFVLTDGERFGAESDMIVRLALALANGSGHGAFGVVVNGGDITRQETYDRVQEATTAVPLLVFDGSGRFGDELAAAARGTPSDDLRVAAILDRVAVHIAPMTGGPALVYAELERLLHG